MPESMKFYERAGRGRRINTKDEPGTIVVYVQRREGGSRNAPVKGNITRSLSVRNAKVSDVARRLELSLFGTTAP